MRLVVVLAVLMGGVGVLAQSTRPGDEGAALRFRAAQAFNRGEYDIALPMLKKVAAGLKNQPERLGPIAEQIRVCEKNLTVPLVRSAAVERSRTPHPAPRPGEVLEMDIKDLGNFEYDAEKGGQIPADVRRLTGARVRLRGYMIPMDQADNITRFALVPSLFSCCYGQPPQIQHTVMVSCKPTGYSPDPVVVEGTLKVEERRDDGYITSIFEVAAGDVKVTDKN